MNSHQSRLMTWDYQKYVKQVVHKLPEGQRISATDFSVPPFYRDSPAMRKQLARVYNSLKLTDAEVGAILNRLKKDNLREDTIIFLYADHGEGIPRGKTNGIDLGHRVPFIIWVPEKYQHLSPWGSGGVVTNELVSFEDLAPTIISLAGGTPPEYMKGRILMGKDRSKSVNHLMLSSGRADNGIDRVRSITTGTYTYSRNYMAFLPQIIYSDYFERGVITKQMREDLKNEKLNNLQKNLFEARPAEYLFSVKKDPWQIHNLADNPEAKPILKKMRKYLKSDILAARDVMFLPEYELQQISKTTTPYKYRMDKEKYPIKKIYNKAISLSGRRGKKIAARQAELLSHSNKIISYWAAIGLRSQPSEVLQPYRDQIMQATRDSYPPVQITASAIAYQQQFGTKKAAEHLKEYAKSDNKNLGLMAVNYLCYVKRKKPFVETIKSILNGEQVPHDVKYACKDFFLTLDLNL